MAIVYTTGTINQADTGSVGQAMAEKIRDDVVAHAAWDLVEEFTAASGQVRWYVLKCLATESGLPNDFYVVIGRTLASGELRYTIGETYNSVAHTLSMYAAYSSGAPVAFDVDGHNPNTFVLGTTQLANTVNQPRYHGWIPSGLSTKWWITVCEDGFTVAFNGASNSFFHCGAYTPMTDLPILMPIQMIGFSDALGGITRNPAAAGLSVSGNALTIQGGGSGLLSSGPALGFMGELRYNDKLQSNQRPVAEQGMNVYVSGGVGDQASIGWALGKQKRMRVTNGGIPPGFAFGDAYALDGRLWVPYLPSEGRIWDTGVPSS